MFVDKFQAISGYSFKVKIKDEQIYELVHKRIDEMNDNNIKFG